MSAILSRFAAARSASSSGSVSLAPKCPSHPLLEAAYSVGDTLGRGCFATVYKGTRRRDGLEVAVKVVDKARLDTDTASLLQNELEVLRAVSEHPGIVTLLDSIETDAHMYFVMEYVDGGPLLDRIVLRGSFSENDARILLRTTLLTLEFLADLGCVHRDIKPENILVDNYSKAWPAKLTDFGLSAKMQPDELLYQTLGTPLFVAPEILTGSGYDSACDIWSLGVVLYLVLCGYPPFPYETPSALIEAIVNGDYSFPAPEWDHVSADAKDALRRMMEVDPQKRIAPKEALAHPWFKATQSTSDLPNSKLKTFNARRKLKASVVAVRTAFDLMKAVKPAVKQNALTQAELLEEVERCRALIKAMGVKDKGTPNSDGDAGEKEMEAPKVKGSRRSLVLPVSIFDIEPQLMDGSSAPGGHRLLKSTESMPWNSQVMSSRAKELVAEIKVSPGLNGNVNPFLVPKSDSAEGQDEPKQEEGPPRRHLQLDLRGL